MRIRLMIALLLMCITFSPVLAQSDEAISRIDQAMGHLSEYLRQTIARDTHVWRWTEKIFPDASFDCPVPDQTYTSIQTRGYQVWITVDGREYDYRLSAGGDIVILCISGQPDSSSIGIEVPDQPVADEAAEFEIRQLGASQWWVWTYVQDTDTLYLLNTRGEQAALPRPRLPDETPGTLPKLTFSRDGRFLIETTRLNSGSPGLGFYAVESGAFIKVHQARPDETVYLGFGYDNSSLTGSPYIVDPENRLVAVGLANTDFRNPTWRIIVFDLVTGDALYQIDQSSPLIAALGTAFQESRVIVPRVVHFAADVVHVQLIQFGAGTAEAYPTFAWHPNANYVEASPFYLTNIDILPGDETAVFSYANGSNITPSNDFFATLDTIGIGQPATAQQLYQNTSFSYVAPRWADNGNLVLFRAEDTEGNIQWGGVSATNGNYFELDPAVEAVYAIPNGYLTRQPDNTIFVFRGAGSPIELWQAPESSEIVIAWASPPGSTFAPTRLYVPLNLTGIVHCPGTPVSNIAIGMQGRVAFFEGGGTLRLRDEAGGEPVRSLFQGTEFTIIGGPLCEGGYTWWRVRLADGADGWSAEGVDNTYYIEPVPEDG